MKLLPSWWSKSNSIVLALCFGSIFLYQLPIYFQPSIDHDEGFYLSIGQSINAGQVLYMDVFDHKPPFVYYFFSFFTGFIPYPVTFLRIANLLLSLSQVIVFFLLGKFVFNLSDRTNTIITILFSISVGYQFLINAENVFTPAILAGFLILFLEFKRYETKQTIRWGRIAIASVLWSIACFTKAPAAVEVLYLLAILVIFFIRQNVNKTDTSISQKQTFIDFFRKDMFTQIGKLASFVIGIIIFPYIVFSVYYQVNGYLDQLLYGVFLFNTSYVSYANELILGLTEIQWRALLAFLTLIITSFFFLKKRLHVTWLICLNWVMIAWFASNISGRPYPHYYIQLMPVLFLFVGVILQKLYLTSFPIVLKIIASLFVICLAILFQFNNYFSPLAQHAKYYVAPFYQSFLTTGNIDSWYKNNVESHFVYQSQKELTDYFDKTLSPDDTIHAVTNRPDIYYASNRLNASKYLVDYHYETDMVDEIYKEIKLNSVGAVIIGINSRHADTYRDIIRDEFRLKTVIGETYEVWVR